MADGSGYAQAAASVGVAAIQAVVATNVANKQYDIAKKQIGMAEFVQDTWKANHLPCELKLLAEVCAKPSYVPAYDMVTLRASNDAAIAFGKSRQDMRRSASPYCIGVIAAAERQITVSQALVEADAIASARRREDGRADLKEQQSIDNRFKVAAIGRNLLDQSSSGYKAAAAGYASGGSTIASALNSGAQLLGYLSQRNFGAGQRALRDTQDDPTQYVQDAIGRQGMGYTKDMDGARVNGSTNPPVTGSPLGQAGVSSDPNAGVGWASTEDDQGF